MEEQEYHEKIKDLRATFKSDMFKIDKEFALANSTLKVGDFATDSIGTIKIDTIRIGRSLGSDTPECVYYGVCYTKKGQPYKSGETRQVWQRNLKQ